MFRTKLLMNTRVFKTIVTLTKVFKAIVRLYVFVAVAVAAVRVCRYCYFRTVTLSLLVCEFVVAAAATTILPCRGIKYNLVTLDYWSCIMRRIDSISLLCRVIGIDSSFIDYRTVTLTIGVVLFKRVCWCCCCCCYCCLLLLLPYHPA